MWLKKAFISSIKHSMNSVEEKCEELYPGYGTLLCKEWRKKQLEYAWIRTLMNQYEDFWLITKDALGDACDELKLKYSYEDIENLLNEYLILKPYSEVLNTLEQIHLQKKMILSNGTEDMLYNLLNNTSLKQYFDDIISADNRQSYKPTRQVYELALEKIGFNWINRFDKKMERLGKTPDYSIDNLSELLQILNQNNSY